MKTLIMGAALAALLSAVPAIAKDKQNLKSEQSNAMTTQENANREKNPDGTFQGKPVVQGPANWHSSASSGASSGEAGSSGSLSK